MKQTLKQLLLAANYFLRNGYYRKIKRSGLFDADYYRDRIPGLQGTSKNPLIHYVDFGRGEGKSPSPLFDPQFYQQTYCTDSLGDPFAHYLEHGIQNHNRPCRWFDPHFYQQQYLQSEQIDIPPLKHFLHVGRKRHLYPNAAIYGAERKPEISIVVPVYNVSALHLNNCIRSVLFQSYPHWQLCLADDCSSDQNVRPLLEWWAQQDDRITVCFLEKNQGISGATNAAASLANGEYLGFLDNDDELATECLATIVKRINQQEADLYYTDEDLIGEDGSRFSVFHKPDYNAELLLSHNYITHFVLVRKALFDRVGGLAENRDGAQDFDLMLKLSEQANTIVHIPEVLYHWRASDSSTSINHEQKSYADEAGRAAVEDALHRRKIAGRVEETDWKFYYTVRRILPETPQVSVVIHFQRGLDFSHWFTALYKSCHYPVVEFCIIVDEEEAKDLSEILSMERVHTIIVPDTDAPAANYNHAASSCRTQFLLFLQAGLQIGSEHWIEELLEHTLDKTVGAVGGVRLETESDNQISTIPDITDDSPSYYARFLQDCSKHMNGLQWSQEVCALSWELMLTEKDRFLEMGGFDSQNFPSLFADSDYCLRLREAGYKVIYSPTLCSHGEGLSKPKDAVPSGFEAKEQFQQKWKEFLLAGDPFYNPGVVVEAGNDQSAFKDWYCGEN